MSQPRFCSTSTRGFQRQRPPRRVTCLVSAREPKKKTKQETLFRMLQTAKPRFTEWCRNRGKEKRAPRGFLKTVRHDQTHTVRLPKSGLVVFVYIFACFLEAAPTPIKHALRSFKRDVVGEVWSSLRWVSNWSVLVQSVVFGRRRLPCTPQRFRKVLLQ